MKPVRSAERRYLPGAIPAMANRPVASVAPVPLTWMLVTPGDTSMRRKETMARRTGAPEAAFDTWPLTREESSGLCWAVRGLRTTSSVTTQRDPYGRHLFRVALMEAA